jgi:predicted nucleotidyltransferase
VTGRTIDVAESTLPILEPAYLADFCRRHGVVRLAAFGSRSRGTNRPDSDLDLLVEFEPGRRVSLFDVGGMMAELTDRAGVQIDIRTPADLSPLVRDEVMREAKTLYAAA